MNILYINAFNATTMLRSLQCVSWHTITTPNIIVELKKQNKNFKGTIWREGRFCYLPGFTGLKECFNLFYCNLTDCTCKTFLWS